jgi:cardiolipin synthase A/B
MAHIKRTLPNAISNPHKQGLLIVFLGLTALVTGCVSVPDAPKLIKETQAQEHTVEVKSNNKVLTNQQAEKIIEKATQGSQENDDLLEKHLLVEQGISDTPLVAGNNVHLLFDGTQTFAAMYETINNAKHHVNLEYFIVENIKFKDSDLQTLLIKKAAQGVQISVIYDAFGSSSTPSEFFETLKANGIHMQEFHPLSVENIDKLNQRDHRKILVADGKIAILGGINLSTTYQSKSSLGMRLKSVSDITKAHWRDTDVMIEGPVVADIQQLFLDHWQQIKPEETPLTSLVESNETTQSNVTTEKPTVAVNNVVDAQKAEAIKQEAIKQAAIKNATIDQSTFFPSLSHKGKELVRVIGSAPSKGKPRYYVTLISAIEHSEKEIILNSGYFVPTDEQKKQLIKAAKRGVNVTLLLPGISDSSMAMMVQHSNYDDLLESGVTIYESTEDVLHAKTLSIDGVWSVIGSSNFDVRSAATNNEVDIVVLGTETANELKAKFMQDISKAEKIDITAWKKRSLMTKIKEKLYRTFQDYL